MTASFGEGNAPARAESAGTSENLRPIDLCALERDFDFFTHTRSARSENASVSGERSESLSCEDLMTLRDVLQFSGETSVREDHAFASELRTIISGFPMEGMAQTIARYDREIAGLIIGIGKKESNWGMRTPKLSGEECYNFWGYRGAGDRGLTADGYGCWNSPEAAVMAIGNRLVELREKRRSADPEHMVVWKCGSSCATHSPESVRKWISDVNLYYREIAEKP